MPILYIASCKIAAVQNLLKHNSSLFGYAQFLYNFCTKNYKSIKKKQLLGVKTCYKSSLKQGEILIFNKKVGVK